MSDSRTIERLLSHNSCMKAEPYISKLIRVDLDTQYRPDRIFTRDEYMKWDMILNNIDTPHRLSKGVLVYSVDRVWLRTELDGLKDFKI